MTTIQMPAVNAPTPDRPYWHEETGGRLAFGDALPRIEAETPAEVDERHGQAIAELNNAAVEARLGEGNGAARDARESRQGGSVRRSRLGPSPTASR
jgi:hypothetical protein